MNNRDYQGGGLTRRPQGNLARRQGSGMIGFDPWQEMDDMNRRMNMLFNRFFGFGLPEIAAPRWSVMTGTEEPDVDIYENDQEYVIHAALPGVDPKDIHLEATEDSITLTAETRSPFEGEGQEGAQAGQSQSGATTGQTGMTGQAGTTGQTQSAGTGGQSQQGNYTQHRQSRYSSMSRFQFSYTLPSEIDPNSVQANFRNGRLELHLPKAQPPAKRSIPVSVQAGGQQNAALSGMGTTGQTMNTGTIGQTGGSAGMGTSGLRENEGRPSDRMGTPVTPMPGEAPSESRNVPISTAGMTSPDHQSRTETSTPAGQAGASRTGTTSGTESRTP